LPEKDENKDRIDQVKSSENVENTDCEQQTGLSKTAESGYMVEIKEDGVFLTVYPTADGGAIVREPVIYEELRTQGIEEFDTRLILQLIKSPTGDPVKIAEKPSNEVVEPEVSVVIDHDKMEASLTIKIPRNSREITLEEVIEKIKLSGVVYGIDAEAVKRAYERPDFRVICAKGIDPVAGADATVQYGFDQGLKGHPTHLDNGRVDFKDLNMFTVVNQGDLLAEKTPPTAGTPGVDVLGQPVPAKNGKDFPVPAGKNVLVNGNQICAAIPGEVQIINNKVNVSPILDINGDVDLSTGNIDFVGGVIVRGSIQSGFTAKAEGNIEIYGSVCGGVVEGDNIIVRMGILGASGGYVRARGNITTNFIESACVFADSDIIVRDAILNSRVSAGKKVIVEGKRGCIVGGHIIATEEIRSKTVGTHMSPNTKLEVGINPEIRNEYNSIRKELKQMEVELDQTKKMLQTFKKYKQSELAPAKQELLLKLTQTQFPLTAKIEAMRNRMTEVDLKFEEGRYGRIRIAEVAYPGTEIIMGTLIKAIRDVFKSVSFYVDEGEIKTGSFR
jgi:uncharacterized protein